MADYFMMKIEIGLETWINDELPFHALINKGLYHYEKQNIYPHTKCLLLQHHYDERKFDTDAEMYSSKWKEEYASSP